MNKNHITRRELNKIIKKLDQLDKDTDYDKLYIINSAIFHDGIYLEYLLGEKPLFKHKISPDSKIILPLEVCAFARVVYDELYKEEGDEDKCIVLWELKSSIERFIEESKMPEDFFSSYETASKIIPSIPHFTQSDLDNISDKELDNMLKQLEIEYKKLKIGISVHIKGTKKLTNLAWQSGLKGVFKYNGDVYCTVNPETHQFKRDLESAVQYELLQAN